MRYVNCPKCEGKLGIPEKKKGKPVTCPVCANEFNPSEIGSGEPEKVATTSSSKKSKSSKSSKPSVRSIPLPSAIKGTATPVAEPKPEKAKSPAASAMDPPTSSKSRLGAPSPPAPVASAIDAPSKKSSKKKKNKSKSKAAPETKKETAKPVAKIIQTESVKPALSQDGKLPSLSLKDDEAPKEVEKPLAENPAFLGLIVCGSIVLSALMLMLAGASGDKKNEVVEEARLEIQEFYEVRLEEEPKQYQLDLRTAQLAHSRGDYWQEVYALQRVMRLFHAEDHNQFKGVTGSPTDDIELKELVSTLLNDAKRLAKKHD